MAEKKELKRQKSTPSLEGLKNELEHQENLIIEQQNLINTLKRQLEDRRIYLEELQQRSNTMRKDNLEQEHKFQKFMEENESLLKNFEYYKVLFKTQIEELENQLVSEKLILATEAEEIDKAKVKISESKRQLNQELKGSYLGSSFISTSDSASHDEEKPSTRLSQDRDLTTNRVKKRRTNSIGFFDRTLLLSEEKTDRRKYSWESMEEGCPNRERGISEVCEDSCRIKLDFEAYDSKASNKVMHKGSSSSFIKSSEDNSGRNKENSIIRDDFTDLISFQAASSDFTSTTIDETRKKSHSESKTAKRAQPTMRNSKERTVNLVLISLNRSPSLLFNSPQDKEYLNEKEDNSKIDLKYWVNEVMALFDKKGKNIQEKLKVKLKDVIKKFIPSKYRSFVWPKLIGNKLKISKAYYKELQQELQSSPLPKDIKNLIADDIKRAYPNLKLFESSEANLSQDLQSILESFHLSRPDIGYVQGMGYLGAILLFHLDGFNAFKAFSNLLIENDCLSSFFKFKALKMDAYFNTFDFFLKEKHLAVYKHLQNKKITKEMFLIEWIYSLFSRAFHLRVVSKIWDLILYYGEVMIFRTALAILSSFEDKLLKSDFDDSLLLIRNCTHKIEEKELFKKILSYNITPEKFTLRLEKEMDSLNI